ncbi:MAG: EamA family transporter [Acidobacteria bacterium]|nr:EamA family transporter [Acidobacteriota bacterium]MBI3427382.1 EamA family transporter [Acidobacteriota bacterium]
MKSVFPLLLAITGGVLYHLGQKSVPRSVSPFAAILLAYAVGSLCCVLALVTLPQERPLLASLLASLRAANGAVALIGIGAVVIEIGFLLAYRAGWNISTASVLTNISVALILLPIGVLLFKEQLSWRNAVGVVCCLLGLYLLSQK